jgi:type IV secretion system protein VirB9
VIYAAVLDCVPTFSVIHIVGIHLEEDVVVSDAPERFTYFKFKTKNAEVPAFFMVDSDGNEALVNYRVSGEYIVIERVTSQYTLRNGTDVVCVFNESMPLEKKKKKK